MEPLPRWRMYGSTAWLSHSAAPRLTSIRTFRSSGVAETASPRRNVPMVLTSTSGGPAAVAIRSMRLLAMTGSVVSPTSRRMPSGSSFSPCSLRSTPATVYPAPARALAVARPSSPPAPTTIVLAAADIEVFTWTTTFAIMQSLRLDRGLGVSRQVHS